MSGLDDLTSPTAVAADPTPPSEAHPKLPGRSRRRRRRKKKAAAPANENTAPRAADLTTPPTRSTNSNSARWASSKATRPGSTANQLPARPPGTRSTSVEHLQSFTSSPVTQHPFSATNENTDRSYRRDHPERRGVFKPARIDPSQDLTATRLRDNISGSGLSSPALQQPSTQAFSGSPSRQLMTDPQREAREAGRPRPGIIYPLPRAARPDTRLTIDAALPEAAALDRRDRPPTVVDIPEARRTTENRLPEPSQPRGSRSPRRQSRKRPRNRSSGVYWPKKRSPHRSYWCE